MGDPSRADVSTIVDFHWLDDPRWRAKGTMFYVKANYELIIENLLDLTHLTFLHQATIGNYAIGNYATAERAEVTTHQTDHDVTVTRWLMDSPPPPTYVKAGGFTANVDRWQFINFTTRASCGSTSARCRRARRHGSEKLVRSPPRDSSGLIYDSASLQASLEKAVEVVDYDGFRREQAAARAAGRYLGIGFGSYIEQTAHATNEFVKRGVPIVFGYDSVSVSLDPSGKVTVDSVFTRTARATRPPSPRSWLSGSVCPSTTCASASATPGPRRTAWGRLRAAAPSSAEARPGRPRTPSGTLSRRSPPG
jgi:hypothetical protein